jgi:hypothetical protein
MPSATRTGRPGSCASASRCAATGSRVPGAGKPSGCCCRSWTAPKPAPTRDCSGRRWSPSPASPRWLISRRPRQYGDQAAELARQLGDDDLLGRSLMICLLPGGLIEPDQSAQLLAEAIACTERSGNQLLLSFLHNNAAVHALRAGDILAARAAGQENPAAAASLGWAQREEGNPQEARSSFQASLRIARRSGEQPVIACAILGLGCLAADLGDGGPLGPLPRHRAGLPRPVRGTVARPRGGVPAAQHDPGTRAPRRRAIRPGLRQGHDAQCRRSTADGPRESRRDIWQLTRNLVHPGLRFRVAQPTEPGPSRSRAG